MCYAVLVTLCQQVAQALGEPLEPILVERVFCPFYHDGQAVQRGECDDLVAFLVKHAKRFLHTLGHWTIGLQRWYARAETLPWTSVFIHTPVRRDCHAVL